MPKAYQISQYDQPLNVDGWLELPDGKRIGIERAHMEEDTGKSTHIGGTGGRIHGSDYSLIDFNRAGVPLVEIVSRPDIRTSEEARQYVTELRAHPPRHRRVRRQDGGGLDARRRQRQRPPARARRSAPAARSRTSTACARSGGPSSTRRAGRSTSRERRSGAPGDPPLGRDRRPHPHPAQQGGRRRLPLLPRARPRAAGARRPSGSSRSALRPCRCCRRCAARGSPS